jgi:hypothetical protein
MNRNFPTYQQDEALRRLAVMLLALAVRAEQAALRSWPVRCFVLWALRPAETAARGYAAEAGYGPFFLADYADIYPSDGTFLDGGPNEATRLAGAFRVLAAVFFALSTGASRLIWVAGQRGPGDRLAGWLNAIRLYGPFAAHRPRYADSS